MKIIHFSLLSAALSLLLLDANHLQAREFERTVTGSRGNSVLKERSVNRSLGQSSVSRSVTGSNGRSYGINKTRQSSVENGTLQTSKTVTGSSGATISKETSIDRSPGQSSASATIEGPNGGVLGYTKSRETHVEDGSLQSTSTVTGISGSEVSRSVSLTPSSAQ